jgi:hypothetical protein
MQHTVRPTKRRLYCAKDTTILLCPLDDCALKRETQLSRDVDGPGVAPPERVALDARRDARGSQRMEDLHHNEREDHEQHNGAAIGRLAHNAVAAYLRRR